LTKFTSIYDKFLSKITDFSIAQIDKSVLEADLQSKLISALAYFPELSEDKLLFTDNGVASEFVETLSVEEEEIIALLMAVNYLDKFIISEDNMRIQLNSKDYKTYSQAALLKELKDTKSKYQSLVDAKKNSYSFRQKFRMRDKNNG